MIEIKDLIESFKNVLLGEELRKEKISLIIEKITKIKIETKDIEVKDGVIILNTKPIFKNEIFLKKELILQELKNSFLKRIPTNII